LIENFVTPFSFNLVRTHDIPFATTMSPTSNSIQDDLLHSSHLESGQSLEFLISDTETLLQGYPLEIYHSNFKIKFGGINGRTTKKRIVTEIQLEPWPKFLQLKFNKFMNLKNHFQDHLLPCSNLFNSVQKPWAERLNKFLKTEGFHIAYHSVMNHEGGCIMTASVLCNSASLITEKCKTVETRGFH
jgi:hypothetical protein